MKRRADNGRRSRRPAQLLYMLKWWEWDPAKAASNAVKHGVTFQDALTVFDDPQALDGPDERHSSREPRFLRLGRASSGAVLVVAYTQRKRASLGETPIVRLISARRANRQERAIYTAD